MNEYEGKRLKIAVFRGLFVEKMDEPLAKEQNAAVEFIRHGFMILKNVTVFFSGVATML